MKADRKKFYIKLLVAVILMFISPMLAHLTKIYFRLNSPIIPFLSLGSVVFFMGTICKLVIDREDDKKARKEKKIKNK